MNVALTRFINERLMMDAIWWLIIILALFFVISLFLKKKDREKQHAEALDEFTRYIRTIEAHGRLPQINDPDFSAQEGEFIVLAQRDVTMLEVRAARVTGGAGTRIKIGSIPLYLGGAHSRPHDEIRETARGTLYLTNRRLVFLGDKRTFTAPFDKILNVTNSLTGITVHHGTRSQPVTFTVSNPLIWDGVFGILNILRPDSPQLPDGARLLTDEPQARKSQRTFIRAGSTDEETTVADKYSLREVFRRYLDSEELSGPMRSIGELIASGAFSRASFDKLMETEGLSGAPNLKEILLDLTLVFTRKCVEDHELSEAEMGELQALVTIFRIEEGDFYELRRAAVQEVIGAQATWVLKDRYVTEQEEVLQRDLQRLFGLSYDQYVALLRPLAKKHIEELESRRLATQDREELKLIESSIRNLRGVFLVAQ